MVVITKELQHPVNECPSRDDTFMKAKQFTQKELNFFLGKVFLVSYVKTFLVNGHQFIWINAEGGSRYV